MTPVPTSITRTPDNHLKISWNDGHSTRISLQYVRDKCPCAGCSGEADLFGRIMMPPQKLEEKEGKYQIIRMNAVGNYALAIEWGDGHANGIYSWLYLLELEGERDSTQAPGL
jgi:DUF971 family protein